MKTSSINIAVWAKHNQKTSAFIFTSGAIMLMILSITVGAQFGFSNVKIFYKVAMLISAILFVSNYTIFKKKVLSFSTRISFIIKTWIQLLLCIICWMHFGNEVNDKQVNYFLIKSVDATILKNSEISKKVEQTNTIIIDNKKNSEYVDDKGKIIFVILFFGLLFVAFLLASLACSLACSGLVAASLVVLYAASVAVVGGFYFLVKSFISKTKRYKYFSDTQKNNTFLGVFIGALLLMLGVIFVISM
jgi:hypothetical protein